MTVWGADIGPDANQKVYDVVVTSADGVVKGGDAFVVGLARVGHLQGSRGHRSGHKDVLHGSGSARTSCTAFCTVSSSPTSAPSRARTCGLSRARLPELLRSCLGRRRMEL